MPDTSESIEDQLIEIEILEAPNTPKHQSIAAAQQKELISILSAKATPFTPKGKQKQVSYADMVKQDLKDDKKKRKTAPISKANNSQSLSKTNKKQPATLSPKTICTVMTGYMLTNKNLI
ncbi:hypothetical protein RhiirA1_475547 [Rhizophagus irregularis]|uniref:Uncharacterized protein n=1 Tax=Rhizophagus irregularis TaxID=588596 RepID=A0A2N0QWR1_9GLOM|nr:hypothetical protein RhiirA1_475547 [Rhizophagus irregularis]